MTSYKLFEKSIYPLPCKFFLRIIHYYWSPYIISCKFTSIAQLQQIYSKFEIYATFHWGRHYLIPPLLFSRLLYCTNILFQPILFYFHNINVHFHWQLVEYRNCIEIVGDGAVQRGVFMRWEECMETRHWSIWHRPLLVA